MVILSDLYFFVSVQLVLRPRSEILDSISGKNDADKANEQEASKSVSQVSSSGEDDDSEPGLLSYIL